MQGTQTQGTDMHTNAAAFAEFPKYPQLGFAGISRKAELAMGQVVRDRGSMLLAETAYVMEGDVACLMVMTMPRLRALNDATMTTWAYWAEVTPADLGRYVTQADVDGICSLARRQADIVATVLYVREEARRGTQVWDLFDAYYTIAGKR